MKPFAVLPALVLLAGFTCTAPVLAQPCGPMIFGSPGEYAVAGGLEVFIADVVAVKDSGTTFGNPPYVTLRPVRILRGHPLPDVLGLTWPASTECDFRCGNEPPSARDWKVFATPYHGPGRGERWVVGALTDQHGAWFAMSQVRFRDDDRATRQLEEEIRVAEERAANLAESRRLQDERDLREDAERLRSADLDALCRASTDVVIATIEEHFWYDQSLQSLLFLASRPQDVQSQEIDRYVEGLDRDHGRPSLRVTYDDGPLIHCRLELAPPSSGDGMRAIRKAVLFLRRGGYVQSQGRVYWLADHRNGILPADSATVHAVRAALARQPMREAAGLSPPAEAGLPFEALHGLSDEQLGNVQGKLIGLQDPSYHHQVQSLLFAVGISATALNEHLSHSFVPCLLPGERYWRDVQMLCYPVPVSKAQMRGMLTEFDHLPVFHGVRFGPEAASLQLRTAFEGRTRICEVLLDADDLRRVADAMRIVVKEDSVATEALYWWRCRFGVSVDRYRAVR